MIFFITVLRALAACLITNAHYTGIYPIDIISNGGLIGDIIFFAVSGYCLSNVKEIFLKWYGKRLYRIYLPIIVITVLFGVIGMYSINKDNCFYWFIYPTYYHFIASIVLLYVPFYFCMKCGWIKKHLVTIMLCIGTLWFLVYLTIYDCSYYHIDNVREPMIRFLFFESMLMGAYFRTIDKRVRERFRIRDVFLTILLMITYIGSKLCFMRIEQMARFQFLNQLIIFILLMAVFRLFAGMDKILEDMPTWIKRIITFISNITLEIYVVQYVIIDLLRGKFFFPINWGVLTGTILISAWALHIVCHWLYARIEIIMTKEGV